MVLCGKYKDKEGIVASHDSESSFDISISIKGVVCLYVYVTGENTIGGGHYSFFIFVFATGHPIRPTNLIFDR